MANYSKDIKRSGGGSNEDRRVTAAVNEAGAPFDKAIAENDKLTKDQITATKDWEKTQTKLQNEQTDFAIQKIEQQKDQAHSDYTKEQSGAYVDWQKQSNQYGANAEQMASMGMSGTGYSESSQVSMYNAYQNRVATARETYNRAVLNYDNSITEAKLQNSSLLAEIAYNSLQAQLQLAVEGFQYKNTLVTQKAAAQRDAWKAMYDQINTENAQALAREQFAEEKRQYNESMKFQREQFNWQKEQAEKAAVINKGGDNNNSGGNSKSSRSADSRARTSRVVRNPNDNSTKNAALKAVSNGSVTHYDEAQKLLSKLGVSVPKGEPRMLNSAEWNKAKRDGQLGSEFEKVNSYKEYVKYYCTWAITNFA